MPRPRLPAPPRAWLEARLSWVAAAVVGGQATLAAMEAAVEGRTAAFLVWIGGAIGLF